MPLGAIDASDATWTMLGEGAATPNLQILGPSLWLFMDSADYCGFRDYERSLSVVVFGYLKVFCDIKCPNDQRLNGSLTILDVGGRVVSRRSGVARPRGIPGAALRRYRCVRCPVLSPGCRVVALEGGRRDATPPI